MKCSPDDIKGAHNAIRKYDLSDIWDHKSLYAQLNYLNERIGGEDIIECFLHVRREELENISGIRVEELK